MKKVYLALMISAVLILTLVVPVSGAFIDSTQVHWGTGIGFGGGDRDSGQSTYVTYTQLVNLCKDVNTRMKTGYYDTSDTSFKSSTAIVMDTTDVDGSYYYICTVADKVTFLLLNSHGGKVRTVSESSSGDSGSGGSSGGGSTDGISDVVASIDDINLFLHTMLDRIVDEFMDVESLVSYTTTTIEAYGESILSYLLTIQGSTTSIQVNVDAMHTVLSGMSANVGTILNRMQGIYDKMNTVDLNVEAIAYKLVSVADSLSSLDESVGNIKGLLVYIPGMSKDLTAAADSAGEIEIDINITRNNVEAILEKLDNLTIQAPAGYDDTFLLNRLDAISSAMQMFGGRLSSISQNTGALLDLFSLGETKTVEVKSGEYTFFDYSELGNIQSVRVSGNDDSGFVLFGVGGNTMDFVTTIAECNDGDISYPDYFWTVNVPTDTLTITVPSVIGLGLLVSRVPAGTYTVSLLDPSGSLISLAAGDKLRPSSTMGRWEVLRTDGGVVSIASCVGLPDGCDFADISPRCARVLVRDLVLAPSLLTSYSDAISYDAFSGYVGSYFQLINTSGESLTVEYVTPSPLLNWYANRQDDFRYWLDTRLNNLPASKAADLTAVTSRLDTIISALQEAPGDAACDHIYQQEATTDATCTLPGLMVSTCSNCGDSYSEIIDPLGHDWQCTDHVAAATDPETGEETAAAYDIYTCSRCGDTYNDYSGDGAPEDYSKTSISRLIVELFSRLGKLAGSLMGFVLNVFDKALTGVDNIITKFNSYTEQITGFGGAYPAWLGGLWGILPTELQVALTFAVVCMAVALVGKKLVFS